MPNNISKDDAQQAGSITAHWYPFESSTNLTNVSIQNIKLTWAPCLDPFQAPLGKIYIYTYVYNIYIYTYVYNVYI